MLLIEVAVQKQLSASTRNLDTATRNGRTNYLAVARGLGGSIMRVKGCWTCKSVFGVIPLLGHVSS